MKIRMSKTYRVYELYDTIEINKEDYAELKDLTDEEALEYLQENIYDFEPKGSYEGSLAAEFEFNTDVLKDDQYDEEHELHLIEE